MQLRSRDSERKNGSAFAAQIAPSTRRNTSKEWQFSARTGHSICLVERLFKREGHPVVQFIVQSAGVQWTLVPGTCGIEALHVPGLREVYSVVDIERPAHVSALRVSAEDPRER